MVTQETEVGGPVDPVTGWTDHLSTFTYRYRILHRYFYSPYEWSRSYRTSKSGSSTASFRRGAYRTTPPSRQSSSPTPGGPIGTGEVGHRRGGKRP